MTLRIPYIIAAVIAALSIVYLASPPGLRAAPVLTVSSLEGRQFDLAAIDGKSRLVTFMSPDCPVSNRNVSVLSALNDRQSPVEVVGVTMPYDSIDAVKQFRADKDISFELVADTDGTISDAFVQVRFTPTTFLIDGQGNIVQRIVGRLQADELDQQIQALDGQTSLAQRAVQ